MIYTLLLLVSSALFLYLCVKRFPLAVHLFLALLPTYLLRFKIGPVPTTLLEVFFFILLCTFLLSKTPLPNLKPLKAWGVPLLLLGIALILSVLTAPSTLEALNIAKSYFIEPALFALILLSTVKTRAEWRSLIRTLLIVASFLGAVALFQALFRIGIPAPWDIEGRAVSLFPYPNAYGLFVVPIIASGLALFFTRREKSWLFLCALPILGLFATKTEAGILALALLVILLLPKRLPKLLLSLALLSTLLLPAVREKVLLEDTSGLVRRSQWSETAELLKDAPIFGAGLNGYPTTLTPYHDPRLYEIFQYPHNIILNIWVEVGLLGLLATIALFIVALKPLLNENDPLRAVVLSVFFVTAVHGLVDAPFFKNDLAFLTAFFIALIGYLTARSQTSKTLRKEPKEDTE